MPTILRFNGLRVVIYPNDHRPSHVHVIGRGLEAVFNFHGSAGPVELRENYGFPRRDLSQIKTVLEKNLQELAQAWERIHDIA